MNEKDRLKAFGNAVRQIRHSQELTQEDLAESAELHRTYICDIERGTRNVTLLSLQKVARALNITGSELLKLAEAAPQIDVATQENSQKCTTGTPLKIYTELRTGSGIQQA